MSSRTTTTMAFLLTLAACSAMPLAQHEPVAPTVIVVESAPKKEEPKPAPPKPEPRPVEKKPEGRKADKVCPPVEGETDNQRIVRKLDCLIERE